MRNPTRLYCPLQSQSLKESCEENGILQDVAVAISGATGGKKNLGPTRSVIPFVMGSCGPGLTLANQISQAFCRIFSPTIEKGRESKQVISHLPRLTIVCGHLEYIVKKKICEATFSFREKE